MNLCITIGRETGSGGRYIGKKIAEQLNIPYYDKELLERVAAESGMSSEIIENHDEKPAGSFLNSLVMDGGFGFTGSTFSELPLNHRVFLAQFDTITKIADEGPCVIVGRCADYALERRKETLSVFIHGDIKDRIARARAELNVSESKARDFVLKTDKARSSYYNYFTNKSWGDVRSYMLSIDSSAYGIDGAAELILDAAKRREAYLAGLN